MNQLWFDPRFGASGDMVLGAFLGLGVDEAELNRLLSSLQMALRVTHSTTDRANLSATKAEVSFPAGDHAHRRWSEIDTLIERAELPDSVKDGARDSFRQLGTVEARIHGTSIEEVRFHEVGADDAIADIVGAWCAWHLLGEPEVFVGTFGLGAGTVHAAHGTISLPAPAVVELLIGWTVHPLDINQESVTPTGAAILTSMALGQAPFPPAGTIAGIARGAGGRNPETHPNVLTVISLEVPERSRRVQTTMVELVTNVDDVTPEVLAYVVDRCLDEGAADAWVAPIVMKKGRPAHTINVLCAHELAEPLRNLVLAETGSLGIRQRVVERFADERIFETVIVQGHEIRIKIGPHRNKPEVIDCIRAAALMRLPLREVQRLAEKAFGNPTD